MLLRHPDRSQWRANDLSQSASVLLEPSADIFIVLYEPSPLLATDGEAVDNMSSFIQDVYILLGGEKQKPKKHISLYGSSKGVRCKEES